MNGELLGLWLRLRTSLQCAWKQFVDQLIGENLMTLSILRKFTQSFSVATLKNYIKVIEEDN